MLRSPTPPEFDRLQDIIHLYLAVARTEYGDPEPHERFLAVQLGHSWAPMYDRSTVEAMVATAYVAVRGGLSEQSDALAHRLSRELPVEEKHRLLRDLGLIAKADGHVTLEEALVIRSVRTALYAEWGST